MGANGKFLNETPLLDELEKGPWPSFIKAMKEYAEKTQKTILRGAIDQLEYSYKTRLGYWKGGVVGVVGYGCGIITRYSMIPDKFPEAAEWHTVRIQPPPAFHYNSKVMRELCDLWEERGSGMMTIHGQTGNLQMMGTTEEFTQDFFDEINKRGWDLGGSGADVRSGNCCVGMARCEMACYDTMEAMYQTLSHYQDELHRPSMPYKMKFKFSGCANDCNNSVYRADLSVQGVWRDNIRVDEGELKNYFNTMGKDDIINNVVSRCPTNAIQVKGDSLEIDNKNCVRCMHCLNVLPKALAIGKERGTSLLVGANSHLKVGNMLGSMIVPFIKMETKEDREKFIELTDKIINWFSITALNKERIGECIERVGMQQFLDDIGLEPHVQMVDYPRDNPYFKAEY